MERAHILKEQLGSDCFVTLQLLHQHNLLHLHVGRALCKELGLLRAEQGGLFVLRPLTVVSQTIPCCQAADRSSYAQYLHVG